MSLKVLTRFPGGNATGIEITKHDSIPEVKFASDPCGNPEALWFYFRLEESNPDPQNHTKVRLTWTFFDNMQGVSDYSTCIPVSQIPGSTWSRLKQGEDSRTPEGLRQLSWLIPHPSPTIDIAFCFPYTPSDLDSLISRSKDFWQAGPIGVSQDGRLIPRIYQTSGTTGNNQPGIYIVARQHAGETPGSWVLDGFLRQWALNKKGGYVIWAVPFADMDGVTWGHYGRDSFPYDLNRAWGNPPMRHETLVIKNDVARWKKICRPVLALDLHSPGACDKDGVFTYVPEDTTGPLAADEIKWCNVIQNELQAEFAAKDFRRVDKNPTRWNTPDFCSFMRGEMGVPALNLQIPYSLIGGNVLSQKSYREIGQRIAAAVLKRKG